MGGLIIFRDRALRADAFRELTRLFALADNSQHEEQRDDLREEM